MAKTRHIQGRMSQRGIHDSMLELVRQFGVDQGDKCILNKKGCNAVLRELDRMRKDLIKMQEKGGVVLVGDGATEITTYRLDSYTRH